MVTATNSEGTASAESAPVSAPPLAAPQITSLGVSPSFGRVGDAFTAGLTAAGNPASTISRQWRLDGVDIAGATDATHVASEPGALTVFVTITNTEGTAVQESDPVTVAPALAAPVVATVSISPAAGRVGDAFAATVAASGEPAPALSYQWLLDGVAIVGATAATTSPTPRAISASSSPATNSEGSASLESARPRSTPALGRAGDLQRGDLAGVGAGRRRVQRHRRRERDARAGLDVSVVSGWGGDRRRDGR